MPRGRNEFPNRPHSRRSVSCCTTSMNSRTLTRRGREAIQPESAVQRRDIPRGSSPQSIRWVSPQKSRQRHVSLPLRKGESEAVGVNRLPRDTFQSMIRDKQEWHRQPPLKAVVGVAKRQEASSSTCLHNERPAPVEARAIVSGGFARIWKDRLEEPQARRNVHDDSSCR